MVTSLNTLIDPTQFKTAAAAVKATCGFNDYSNEFAVPSLGLKLGHLSKKCASIMKCEALQNSDEVFVQRVNNFTELCGIEWPCHHMHGKLSSSGNGTSQNVCL